MRPYTLTAILTCTLATTALAQSPKVKVNPASKGWHLTLDSAMAQAKQ